MMQSSKRRWAVLLLGVSLWLSGCASQPLAKVRDDVNHGHYAQALERLDASEFTDRDRLLVYLHKGLILHELGRYEDSNQQLLQAAELIEALDQIDISEQLSTLAVNEWLATYRGEYSERLWVHSYLMMNFLLLGDAEAAAVEARRALRVFDAHPKPLKNAFFTRALTGLSFEHVGLLNDAVLEYRVLADALPNPAPVAARLHRYARELGLSDVAEKYKTEDSSDGQVVPPGQGELVVFVARGRIPKKVSGNVFVPPDIRLSWPEYAYTYPLRGTYTLRVSGAAPGYSTIRSDMALLARTSLAARATSVATKQVARAVAKHAIVDEVSEKDPLVAGILQLALFVLEEADTRGWDVLPQQLDLLRVPLPVGEHNVQLSLGGQHVVDLPMVKIVPGSRVFHKVRLP